MLLLIRLVTLLSSAATYLFQYQLLRQKNISFSLGYPPFGAEEQIICSILSFRAHWSQEM